MVGPLVPLPLSDFGSSVLAPGPPLEAQNHPTMAKFKRKTGTSGKKNIRNHLKTNINSTENSQSLVKK